MIITPWVHPRVNVLLHADDSLWVPDHASHLLRTLPWFPKRSRIHVNPGQPAGALCLSGAQSAESGSSALLWTRPYLRSVPTLALLHRTASCRRGRRCALDRKGSGTSREHSSRTAKRGGVALTDCVHGGGHCHRSWVTAGSEVLGVAAGEPAGNSQVWYIDPWASGRCLVEGRWQLVASLAQNSGGLRQGIPAALSVSSRASSWLIQLREARVKRASSWAWV